MTEHVLPGAGDFTDPPTGVDREEISRLIAEGERLGNEIKAKVANNAVEAVADAERDYRAFHDNFMGSIGNSIDKAAAAMRKPQEKIMTSLRGSIGDAYSQMATYGFPFPEMEQVRYGNQTGDYLGSVGFGITKPGEDSGKPLPTGISVVPPSDSGNGVTTGGYPPLPIDGIIAPPTQIVPPQTNGQTTQPPVVEPQPQPPGALPVPVVQPPIQQMPPGAIGPTDPPICTSDWGGRHWVPPLNCGYGCVFADDNMVDEPSLIYTPPGSEQYNRPVRFRPGTDLGTGWQCWITLRTANDTDPGPDALKFWLRADKLPFGHQDGHVWGTSNGSGTEWDKCFRRYNCGTGTIVPPVPAPGPKPPDQCGPCDVPAANPDACPAPAEKPKCPQPIQPLPGRVEKGDDVCAAIDDLIKRMGDAKPELAQWIGAAPEAVLGGPIARQIIAAITGQDRAVIPGLINAAVTKMQGWLDAMAKGIDCDRFEIVPIVFWRAIFGFLQRWLNIVPDQLWHNTQTISNTVCQHNLPSGAEADAAWLRGTITDAEWECYHKAQGDYLKPAGQIRDAARAKLDPTQLDKLWRRKYIDEATYRKLIREAGVILDEDQKNIHDINDQWPTLSDTTMLLQRDVADEVNVDWTEADKIFEQKYTGKVKDWYDANGVPKDMAKMFWRAHFHIPSATMGYQMLHRLRPDNPDNTTNFDRNDLKQMLLQDDWHPAFIDRMIDISYRPVTASDAVKAYMIYAIDDEKLKNILLDNGRSPAAAEFYVSYHKKNREIQTRRRSGYPLLRTLVNQFARCEVSENDYRDTVAKLAISEEQEKFALDAAKLSRSIRERRDSVAAVKKQFVRGTIDEGEASALLADANVDPSCVSGFLETWSILRLRQDKHATGKELCELRWYGLISLTQQVEALIRIGYAEEDAVMIAALCTANLDDKKRKQLERANEKALRELRRQQREAAKAQRFAECGPPACPKNTPGGSQGKGGGPKSLHPGSNGTGANGHAGL